MHCIKFWGWTWEHWNGKDYLIKELTWWDDNAKKVRTVRLQSDGSHGTSKEVAESWDVALAEIGFWLLQLDPTATLCKLYGQTTDSGGGGVLYSVKGEFR